jgi:hypothetical protein
VELQLWSSKADSTSTLIAHFIPSSTSFHLHYNHFNTTCFSSHLQSHLLANKRFRDRAASYIGIGGSQRLLRALPGAIIFGEPSPKPGLLLGLLVLPENPSTLQHQET